MRDKGQIVKQFDYTPFGSVIPLLGNVNRTKFIGKEKDKESNYADHGVRKYDDELGRFTSIDPLWEKYYSLTPYQYAGNNPVSFLDGNGMLIAWDPTLSGKERAVIKEYHQSTKTLKEAWQLMEESDNTVTITKRGSDLSKPYEKGKNDYESFVIIKDITNSFNGKGSDCIMSLVMENLINAIEQSNNGNKIYKKEQAAITGHEDAHALGSLYGNRLTGSKNIYQGTSNEDIRAMGIENRIRSELNIPLMNHYPAPSGLKLPIPLGPIVTPLKEIFNAGE